jgi:hypothetical protein
MIKIINQGKSKEAFLFLKRELCKKIPNEFNMKITNQLTHLLSIWCQLSENGEDISNRTVWKAD